MSDGQPVRIQLRRTRGWRKAAGAVIVSRPSRWGNPFKVGTPLVPTAEVAVAAYRAMMSTPAMVEVIRSELRGLDLACWCKIGDPCHADVLLEIANRP